MSESLIRRLEIVKLLQGKEMRTSEIADHFGVDERTIRMDINELRKGFDFFGTKIKIESKHYDGNPRQYYKSTVHPIILALNSSELFALLKLLENAMTEPAGEVYKQIFNSVYSQITDYAEKLFTDKFSKKYSKSEVQNRLEEDEFARHVDYKLVYWQKTGRFITITYINEDKQIVDDEVRLVLSSI